MRSRALVTALIGIVLYAMSYAINSLFGGYVWTETGNTRKAYGLSAGIAAPDVMLWLPRFGRCQWYRYPDSNYALRYDTIGLIYSPLILLDQSWCHPSILTMNAEGEFSLDDATLARLKKHPSIK
jgi:hypothetical protein